jgi:mono/diheme cytochrome c family protein
MTTRQQIGLCAIVLAGCALGLLDGTTPARGAAADAAGRAVYLAHCVECHGTSGRGDGPAAAFLTPRPLDFTSGKYKIRSTPTGVQPTDDDLTRSIRDGLPGSAMPAWKDVLSDAQIRAVVDYIKSLSPRFDNPPPVPVRVAAGPPTSAARLDRGRQVYDTLQCGKCHGVDGRGTGAVAIRLQDDWQQPLPAANLTEPWTFHGGASARDVYLRLRTGMAGTPMPSFADAATDTDLWDLAAYVVSLGRKPVWSMTAAEVTSFYRRQDAEARAHPVKRGAYLVETLGCTLCHSPIDGQGRMLPGLRLAGGMRIRVEPFGEYPSGNLTSDKATGLGDWTDGQIENVITRGVLPDGSRLLPYPMDYASYSTMTPEDLNAIVAYLRTVPPVSNTVPKPTRTFLPVYLWGKFKLLFLGGDPPIVFFPGNAGSAGARS